MKRNYFIKEQGWWWFLKLGSRTPKNQQFSLKKSENRPTLVTTHHPSAL